MNEDIIRIDSYDFDEKTEFGLALVFFYAEWNVHSRGLEPILEEIADEYYDSTRVYAVDVEQSPDIATRYEIETLPTVVVMSDGQIVHRITGANPPSTYASVLDELLSE